MLEKLVIIERKNLPTLRDLYSVHDPITFLGHCTVDYYIRLAEKEPNTNILFYCLNGDWNDGTFVAIDRCYIFVNTLAKSSVRLAKLLQLIDFSRDYIFITILDKDYPCVLEVLQSKNVKIENDLEMLYYHLAQATALEFESQAPAGFTLNPIDQSDVHIIDDAWPHRHSGSQKLLVQMVRCNPNIGIYNENNLLVAWALRLPDGPLSVLQVDKNYYGRGFGKIVTKAVLRQIAEMGHDNVACIFEWNKPSRQIFEKLGFRLVGKINRIITGPALK